jgi:DNA-binding PadR family transcriptional regulator
MAPMEVPPVADSSDEDSAVSVSKLRSELSAPDAADSGTAVADVVDEVEANLFDNGGFEFADGQVKSSLDELLLSIVALRSSDTHGKQLLDDLGGEFDTMLSPGTVYPRLHGLCDEGVLQRRELVSTKEYTLDDTEAARARIAEAAKQHLALGMVLHAALEDGEFN